MTDPLQIASIILGTYVAGIGFTVILIRLFFPFKTSEQMKEEEMQRTMTLNKMKKHSLRKHRFANPSLREIA